MAKKTSKKKTSKKTTARSAAKKTSSTRSTKKTSSTRAAKKTSKRPAAKAKTPPASPSAEPTASTPRSKRRAKKTTAAKATSKTATTRQPHKGGKAKGKCGKAKCSSGTCSTRTIDGRSLLDRARECQDLEECRGFIRELSEAVEQANTWLDEMHTQALSAEHTRDLYGEQISDLMEAISADEARIAQLEAELKNERGKPSQTSKASQAVLDKLAELHKEVRTIRADLRRLQRGEAPTAERRRRVRQANREQDRQGRGRGRAKREAAEAEPTQSSALMDARPTRRPMDKRTGPFAKYSVLRGAACSLGVGKYGYPPEVCAPAAFSRSEAAEILGTYAQNKYAGLAKWALITGLPIDDVAIPLVPAVPQGRGGRAAKPGRAPSTSTSRRKASSKTTTKGSTSAAPRTSASKKAADSGRSNRQIIDQVLLTVARI